MNWWRVLKQGFQGLIQKESLDREMDEEMRFHLELRTRRNIEAGMSPEEAHNAAMRRFGAMEQVKEVCRDYRGVGWIENWWRDFCFGVRVLNRNRSLTVVDVLTLALSVGASTVLFGVLKALVLNPFPFPDSDRLVYVWNHVGWPLPVPDFKDIREQNGSLAELGVFMNRRFNFGLESPEWCMA